VAGLARMKGRSKTNIKELTVLRCGLRSFLSEQGPVEHA